MCCNFFVLETGYIHYTFLSYRLRVGTLTLGGPSSMTWMYTHIDVFPSSPLTVALPKSCVTLCMSTESRLLDQSTELLLESIGFFPPHLPYLTSFTRTQLPVFAPFYLSIVFLSSENHCLVLGEEEKRPQKNRISGTQVCIRH